jgi:hypothetical protein
MTVAEQRVICTVQRRGVRFIREERIGCGNHVAPAATEAPTAHACQSSCCPSPI